MTQWMSSMQKLSNWDCFLAYKNLYYLLNADHCLYDYELNYQKKCKSLYLCKLSNMNEKSFTSAFSFSH